MKTECDILAENDHPFILYPGCREPGRAQVFNWSSGGQHTDVVIRMLYHYTTSGIWWQSLRRRPMWACSPRSWQEASVRKCFLAEPCCDWKDLGYVRMHNFHAFRMCPEASFGLLWESYQWCCHGRCTGASNGDVGIKMHPAKGLKPLILTHCSICSTWEANGSWGHIVETRWNK